MLTNSIPFGPLRRVFVNVENGFTGLCVRFYSKNGFWIELQSATGATCNLPLSLARRATIHELISFSRACYCWKSFVVDTKT
jgi:hypothetical protein